MIGGLVDMRIARLLRTLRVALLSVFMLPLLAFPACADAAYDNYFYAQKAIQNGEWKQALTYLSKAVQADPKYLNAYIARGFVYGRLGKLEEALSEYDRVLQVAPQNPVALGNKGFCLYKFGRYEEALAILNKSLELDPERADFLANRGEVFLKLGQLDACIADCSRAIHLDDSDADSFITRGDAYAAQKKLKEALKDYTKAIALNPDPLHMYHAEGESYYRRGQLYLKMGKTVDGERDLLTSKEAGYKPDLSPTPAAATANPASAGSGKGITKSSPNVSAPPVDSSH